MNKKLSLKKRILAQRQQNFTLDCNNSCKSKMQQYNPLKDKYMKYMIPASVINYVKKQTQQRIVQKHEFQQFIAKEKQRILNSSGNKENKIQEN